MCARSVLENYRIRGEDIKDDINKLAHVPCVWTRRFNTVKRSPHWSTGSMQLLSNTSEFFQDIDKLTLKFVWKVTDHTIIKATLTMKNRVGGIPWCSIIVIVIKTMWGETHRSMEQKSEPKNRLTKICSTALCGGGTKAIQWRKDIHRQKFAPQSAWPVWLSRLGILTGLSPLIRAHAWVAGLVLSGACASGNQ